MKHITTSSLPAVVALRWMASLLTCMLPLAAQTFPRDLLGLTFAGDAIGLASRTGHGALIAATGQTGYNGSARVGDSIYACAQVGSQPPLQYFLDRIDDATGQATRLFSLSQDLRAMATSSSGVLYAVAQSSPSDTLVRVSVATGAISVVGPIGFGGVQGLTERNGDLYGWDLTAGLLQINTRTGAGVDVNPAVGTNGFILQFLTTMADGRIVGGNNSLYEVDPGTGVPDHLGAGQYNDLRAGDERYGVLYTFGVGCQGVNMTLSGVPQSPTTITTTSIGHDPTTLGAVQVGFSDRNFRGHPLPLSVDHLLGTVGCVAYAGPDISYTVLTSGIGVMNVVLSIPAGMQGFVFHVQHISLSNSPGGVAFSNGGTVRLHL